MGQDIFEDKKGKKLEGFYKKLTPGYAARKLAEMINGEQMRKNEAGLFLMEDGDPEAKETRDYLKGLFEFADEEALAYFDYGRIKNEEAVEILMKMGLLVRGPAEDGTGPRAYGPRS